jgi:glycosyltransferase involved in cell wall biosynthesis
MEEFPKLLLLSDEGPQMSTAGGILLFRLLQNYPTDRLRVIERRVEPGRTRLNCRYDSLATPWRRLEQSRFHRWHRTFRAFGLVPVVPSCAVDALLKGFQPDVVLCVMQFSSYYETAWRYARKRGLPLVVIVHDVNEEWESVFPGARRAQRHRDGEFYRYASRRLCISPEMEMFCAGVYGARGDVLYPNRSEALTPRRFEESLTLKTVGKLTVGFVGSLNYGYGDELLRLLPSFRTAQARVIAFSTPPGGTCVALLQANDCFDFRGFAPGLEAWRIIQTECDAVILPYSTSAGMLETLYRHHFPSKLPEYLALGMPVIVTGPDYATGVKWGLAHPEAAATATRFEDVERLLARLRDDADWRVSLARGAFRDGDTDFNPVRIREEFLRHLRVVARLAKNVAE